MPAGRPRQSQRISVKGLRTEELDVAEGHEEVLGPSASKYDWQRPMPIKISVGKQTRVELGSPNMAASLADAFTSIAQDLKLYTDQLEEYMPNDLGLALEPTFQISQERVPVKTGDLQASGYLAVESFRGGARVEIGYGKGGVPDYAVAVHEMTDIHHASPTGAKYLEAPLNEDFFNIQQRIVDNIKTRLGV